jgi:hypothetical protein
LTPPVKVGMPKKVTKLIKCLELVDLEKKGLFGGVKYHYRRFRRRHHDSRKLTTFHVGDVKPAICFSHYSKALLKQMVLGMVASDGLRYPFIFAAAGNNFRAATF